MKHITLLLVLIIIAQNVFATDYYIANNGSDNNNGTSSSTPFKTIDKLNTLALKPGDKILFHRGDIFRGQLMIKQSGNASQPIIINAYGTGVKPVITGSRKVNNFSLYGNHIYSASFNTNPVVVFYDDKPNFPARYPNKGFLTVDNAQGKQKFYDAALTQPSGYWDDATIHHRMVRWHYGEHVVESFSNGNVMLQTPADYNFTDGWGYYFSNKFEELDTAGEFFYNTAQKKLYIWSSAKPADNAVEASVFEYGIYLLQNAGYVQIKNISFQHQKVSGISSNYNNTNITVQDCRFNNIYNRAISFASVNNVTIENNFITDMYGKGITAYDCKTITVKNNTVRRVGLYAGRATAGEIGYSAMEVEGNIQNGNISLNTFDSIGYLGLRFSINTVIEKNNFSNYCLTTDDGSAIYTWSNNDTTMRRGTGCIIRNNIIQNGIGNNKATNEISLYANGIYMDDASGYATIKNNTVNNCSNIGIFLHNSKSNTVQNNTVFNCARQIMGLSHDDLSTTYGGNTINGNIFYSVNENVYPLTLTNYITGTLNYATYSDNYYCNPYNDLVVYKQKLVNGNYIYDLNTLNQWKASHDNTAKGSYVKLNAYAVTDTIGSNLITNGNFNTNLDWWYCWSPDNSCNSVWGINNKLNNGSWHLQCTNGIAYNTKYFSLNANQYYQLSFSSTASIAGNITVQTMDASTYAGLELSKIVPIKQSRSNDIIIFKPTYTTNPARVNFYVNEESPDYWLDNIKLFKVKADYDDPLQHNFIFINSTNQTKTIPLNKTYVDVDNNTASGSITLQPFSSKILILAETQEVAAFANDSSTIKEDDNDFKIYPNPAGDFIIAEGAKQGNNIIKITDANGHVVLQTKIFNAQQQTINISKLAKGTYFITVGNKTKKFVK